MIAEATAAAKTKRRTAGRADSRKPAERIKATLILDAQTDLKLTVLAAMRGLDRSTLANMLISEGVRSVTVSIRGERPADADNGEDRQEIAA